MKTLTAKSGVAVAALLVLAVLGGCASLDEMNANLAAQQQSADQAKCEGYGYQPGTDRFADCMMSTAHHRDMQQAISRQQDAAAKQHQDDQWEREKAQNEADNARRRADMERTMNSTPSISPVMPTGSNCTSTTTTSQGDNAGTSTTTSECH